MKHPSPKVLVVVRHRDASTSEAIREAVGRQTYTHTRLVLVHDDDDQHIFSDDNSDFCPATKLLAHACNSSADMILFWPDHGTLRDRALEKLVLALQLAPDQQGVADAAQASTGLWLARFNDESAPLVGLWLESQAEWINTCRKSGANFFHIPEHLMAPCPKEISHPNAVEHLFAELPLELKSFEPVSTEKLLSRGETLGSTRLVPEHAADC